MTARSANTALDNMTRSLVRTTLPRLPPALGFDGDVEYMQQVDLWRKWIDWEQEDPLVLKEEDNAAYKQRVLYVYKQAVMALRFWPEMWVDAAEWCFSNGMDKDGNDFLTKGIAANPESCLLAFKHADRLEITLPLEEGDDGIANRGTAVRAPYNLLLDALYDLLKKLKDREEVALAKVQEDAELNANIANVLNTIEDDDEDGNEPNSNTQESNKANAITAIKQGYAMQTSLLSKTISFAWIALTRAMRRVQGKGKVGDKIGGSRQILTDARVRGRITSDVYVASALIEHHVYKDPAGTKIFERGAKLYAEDETYILEYLKHLLSIGDTTSKTLQHEFHPFANHDQMLVWFSKPPSIAWRKSPNRCQKPSLCMHTFTSTNPNMVNCHKSPIWNVAWLSCSLRTRNSPDFPLDMQATALIQQL